MDEEADRSAGFLQRQLRSAGRQLAEAKQAYAAARRETLADVSLDDDGRARIVCRRFAEKRTVAIDDRGRPDCADEDHPDCRGCIEDLREGSIETW